MRELSTGNCLCLDTCSCLLRFCCSSAGLGATGIHQFFGIGAKIDNWLYGLMILVATAVGGAGFLYWSIGPAC